MENVSSPWCKISSRGRRNFSSKDAEYFWCPCDDVCDEKIVPNDSESEAEVSAEIEDKKKSLWEIILEESEARDAPYVAWLEDREKIETDDEDSSSGYLDREIFPILLPGMEKMLREARRWNALKVQKCRFDGLDYLAEYLWNKNPKWPRRKIEWREAFEIPQFKLCMRMNPRPIYPKSWLWSAEEAVVYLQRWVRGWLVRKRDDVQELRQFWKAIAERVTVDENQFASVQTSQVLNMCERYKFLAKRRDRPF